jgi:IclR family transcriptional regulator, acetate operon repressor
MTVSAVDRCISLIEILAEQPNGMDLGALAAAVSMPKSATHRILTTLLDKGWVAQDSVTLGYRLSLTLANLAFRQLDAMRLPDAAQAPLDDLARKTHEYCRLAVVDGERLVWVARAQGATSGLRYDPDMGHEVVLHATATGKAWLATLPEAEALRIVAARGLSVARPPGPRSARTMDEVRDKLAETRARGYALAVEEGEAGTVAMAMAFRAALSPDAPVAGTVSVAGPLARIGAGRHSDIVAALHSAVQAIERIWPVRRYQRGASEQPARPLQQVV